MSKARKWSYEACKEEQRFIESINPVDPGDSYNNDPKCFANYCNMQANHIEHSGFPLIAADVRQCRDIANPTYRSEALCAS